MIVVEIYLVPNKSAQNPSLCPCQSKEKINSNVLLGMKVNKLIKRIIKKDAAPQ